MAKELSQSVEVPLTPGVERRGRRLAFAASVMGAVALASGGIKSEKKADAMPLPPAAPLVNLGQVSEKVVLNSAIQNDDSALERSYVDRLDDVEGPQVHYLYVVPAEVEDRALDTNGTIERSVWNTQDWLAGQADGHSLRLDTYQGELDISFYRSKESSDSLASSGPFIVDRIRDELWAAGFSRSQDKILTIFYDGPTIGGCGWANRPRPGFSPGNAALHGLSEQCRGYLVGSANKLSWEDLGALHETLHVTGQVPESAPNYDTSHPGHTNTAGDLMSHVPPPLDTINDWGKAFTLDPGRDDYYYNLDRWRAPNHGLITVNVNGQGVIESEPQPARYLGTWEVPCEDDCELWYRKGAAVELSAEPSSRSFRFSGWRGACTGKNVCEIEVNQAQSVQANFERVKNLDLRVRGRGTVRVMGRQACRKLCEYQYRPGAKANLLAVPGKNKRFVRWIGGCATKPRCNLRLKKDRKVTAVFAKR